MKKRPPKRFAAWQWQAFLLKFMTAQGGTISTLLLTEERNLWRWASCLFVGGLFALGVDTTTWLVSKPEETTK